MDGMKLGIVLLPLLLAGCFIEVEDGSDPISPQPFPDDDTPPSSKPPQGIDVGEPNPNSPREGFRRDYEGNWCYYDDQEFQGRVFADQEKFNQTWHDFIACYPEADLVAYPAIDWKREFVMALIAPPSGCMGAELDVVDASAEDERYTVRYDHQPPPKDQPCAAAMSRPIEFISMDRWFGDKLDVRFEEIGP